MKLRNIVLGSLAGMDTLKEASSNFNSKMVGDALDDLINVIIEVITEISKAYDSLNVCMCFVSV